MYDVQYYIDTLIQKAMHVEKFKICPLCNTEALVSERTCKSCKGKLLVRQEIEGVTITSNDINPYNHLKVGARANEVEVVVGKPDMLNPNSFENLSSILQTLGRRVQILIAIL